jgi:hypothetical protein
MERSEGVSVVLDRIMKMVDRSGERLLRSFDRLEGSAITVRAAPKGRRLRPAGVVHPASKADSASTGADH